MSKKPSGIGFLATAFLWMLLAGSTCAAFQNKPATHYSLPAQVVAQIYTLQKNAAISFTMVDESGHNSVWKGRVINHINQGTTTGAISAHLQYNGFEYKLLMSRKPLNGKVVYTISLLPVKEGSAYKLDNEKDGQFVLKATPKDKIVTP